MNKIDFLSPEERVLGRILKRQAELNPETLFVIEDEKKYTYKEANSIVNSYASGLKNMGVQKGDVVTFYLSPCADYVFVSLAVNKLGAIWSGINTDYKKDWLLGDLKASCSKVLVTENKLLPRLLELGDDFPCDSLVLVDGVDSSVALPTRDVKTIATSEWLDLPDVEPDQSDLRYSDTCAILWTSGTTGRPKGVMQSHNVWVRSGISTNTVVGGFREGDVLYCCLPLYNSGAWASVIYPALVNGVTTAIDPYFSVDRFWDRCRYYNATYAATLGAMTMFLWNRPEKPDDASNPVRNMMAVPIPEHIIKPFMKRFGINSVFQGYGQSEVMPLLRRIEDGKRVWKPNCPGVPLDDIEVKLLDDDDRETPPGTPGEFCVRPLEPYIIFNGYFNDPEATLESFRNLWYHTGDLGIRDADGDYFFYDRKADYIRFKGRNISSFQIEAILNKHPEVAESAAFGVSTEYLSSEAELMVAIVLKPGSKITEEDIARFVNDNAPYWCVPRYVEFVDQLPKTPTMRVQKYKLRERGVTGATWDAEAAGFKVTR